MNEQTEMVYDEEGLVATIVTVDHGDGTGTRTTTSADGVVTTVDLVLPIVEDEATG